MKTNATKQPEIQSLSATLTECADTFAAALLALRDVNGPQFGALRHVLRCHEAKARQAACDAPDAIQRACIAHVESAFEVLEMERKDGELGSETTTVREVIDYLREKPTYLFGDIAE